MGETSSDMHGHLDAPKRPRPAARTDLRSRREFQKKIETPGTRESNIPHPVDAKDRRFECKVRQRQTFQGKCPEGLEMTDGCDPPRRPAQRQATVDHGPKGPHKRGKIDAPPDEIRARDRPRALPGVEADPGVRRQSGGASDPPRERNACPRIHDPKHAGKLDPGVREPGREVLRSRPHEPPLKLSLKDTSEKSGAKVRNDQMRPRHARREAESGNGNGLKIDAGETRTETETRPRRSGGVRGGIANARHGRRRRGRPPNGRRGGVREAKSDALTLRLNRPAPAPGVPGARDRPRKMRPRPPSRPGQGERSRAEPSRLRRTMRRHEQARVPRTGAEPRDVAHDGRRQKTKTNRSGRVRDLRLDEDGSAGHGGPSETRVGEDQGRNRETGAVSLESVSDPTRSRGERSGKRQRIAEIEGCEMKRARLDPVHHDPAPDDDRG